jgi:hypothetical protein
MRVEHENDRGGALQYLAAWDCHRARLFGCCEPRTGIAPFDRLVEQVMTIPPYAKAFGSSTAGPATEGFGSGFLSLSNIGWWRTQVP